jgi:hypothetical protein
MTNENKIDITTGYECVEGNCYSYYEDKDPNLVPGVLYKYSVAGVNAIGEGFSSNELSVLCGQPLPDFQQIQHFLVNFMELLPKQFLRGKP